MKGLLKTLLLTTAGLPLRYRHRTIARDLAFRLVLGLTISLLLAGIVSLGYQIHSDQAALHERAKASANDLAAMIALPVWTFNEIEITALIETYGLIEDIASVQVVDENGLEIDEFLKPGSSIDILESADIVYKDIRIGSVTIGASTESLYAYAWRGLWNMLALVALAILIVTMLVLPLVEHFLEIPLNKLIVGIQRIARGEYNDQLPEVPQRELARITDEVNHMAEQIASRERQIIETMQATALLNTEIGLAKTLQRSINATRKFNATGRVAQYYQPMSNLSGDWLTVFECDHGETIYAMVGDVTGHGIPQGLVTMAAFGTVQTLTPLIQKDSASFTPAGILNILRSTLATTLDECQLAMTVSIIRVDLVSRRLLIASAGHPLPLTLRSNGSSMTVSPLAAKGQSPLGFEFLSRSPTPPPYTDTTHSLADDDVICLFSDGLSEARSKANATFQREFVKTLRSIDRAYPASVILDKVLQRFQSHTNDTTTTDDVCLMVIDTRRTDSHEAVA